MSGGGRNAPGSPRSSGGSAGRSLSPSRSPSLSGGRMEPEGPEAARGAPSRHEKSLGLLTRKFVCLLQEATDGVLDLKVAADSLAVKQKRRIYDITNVMEGVGLIEKKTKNTIQWRGEKTGIQTQEAQVKVDLLKAQMAELEAQEKELDQQRTWLEENMKRLNNDPFTGIYKFVTNEDICDAFSGETLLAVMAPAGTQLEVPLPEVGQSGQKKYQMNLRSQSAPIQVTLINREPGCSVPMVFSLPPTDEICLMPNAPPSAPACLQRVLPSVSVCSASSSSSSSSSYSHQDSLCSMYSATNTTSSSCCSQESVRSDQQVVLPERGGMLTPPSPPPDVQMACHFQPVSVSEQLPMGLSGPELQSVLDVSSLLKLNPPGEPVKDDREGAVDFIDELMSTDGIDYSFNLDENEGVCDLFDVQILNYC